MMGGPISRGNGAGGGGDPNPWGAQNFMTPACTTSEFRLLLSDTLDGGLLHIRVYYIGFFVVIAYAYRQ